MANFYASYPFIGGGGGGSGVTSLNTLTGDLTLAAGTGISITPSGGDTLTIAATGGTGTVTSVSVVSANGFAGTVATPTATPAITLTTTITGLLKGNGTAISAQATGDLTDAGTDGIIVTGGTGAVIGAGTSIAQHVADTTHNGYLSSTDWNTFNGKQAAGNYITALTGDITASGPGSAASTLATVNSNVGSFGSATQVAGFTVNAKGLVTAASNTSIQIAESQVTNLTTDLAAKQSTTLTNTHILVGNVSNVATDVAMSGDATLAASGALTLATVATGATVGSSTSIPAVTFNNKGLVTGVTGNAVVAPAGTLTGTTLASNVVTSSLTSVGTIATGVWNGTAVDVSHGGTGATSATAYAVLCGGTTSTGAHQSIASVGTSTQVLTSNGPGALPTFQAPTSTTRSQLIYDTGNGYGSSSKAIRLVNQRSSIGSNLVFADTSAAAASTITCQVAGKVNVSFSFGSSANGVCGITINNSSLNTNPQSLTYAQGIRAISNETANNGFVSWSGIVAANDVLQFVSDGNTPSASANTMVTVVHET